jgi:hypothetical protein
MQWLHCGGTLTWASYDSKTVAAVMLLGALLDGVLNPMWDAEVCKRLYLKDKKPFRLRALHFALNSVIWTPACCLLLLGIEDALNSAIDLAFWSSPLAIAELENSAHAAMEVSAGPDAKLIDSATASSQLNAMSSLLGKFVPPPLRPFIKRLADVSSWTLLDELDDGVVPGDF